MNPTVSKSNAAAVYGQSFCTGLELILQHREAQPELWAA